MAKQSKSAAPQGDDLEQAGDSPESQEPAPAAGDDAATEGVLTSEHLDATVSLPPAYAVAPQRGITSLRGILGEGEVVSARDFPGGQETLDHLVDVGAVIKS